MEQNLYVLEFVPPQPGTCDVTTTQGVQSASDSAVCTPPKLSNMIAMTPKNYAEIQNST